VTAAIAAGQIPRIIFPEWSMPQSADRTPEGQIPDVLYVERINDPGMALEKMIYTVDCQCELSDGTTGESAVSQVM
jgi:hypothetical protein